MPSRRRFSTPLGSLTSSRSLIASVSTRLISSGIERSKLRSPASTCATRTPSFTATSAQAIVLFTSPTTTTQSGRCSRTTGSNRFMISAVCTAWLAEPTSRLICGSGIPSCRKNSSLMFAS